jgi:hypothetical protein
MGPGFLDGLQGRVAERLTRSFSLYLLLELIFETDWRNVYGDESKVRPGTGRTIQRVIALAISR